MPAIQTPIIDKIVLNGTTYNVVDNDSGYTSFDYVPITYDGEVVGTMTFNGSTYTIYAPQATSTDLFNITVENNDTELSFRHVLG